MMNYPNAAYRIDFLPRRGGDIDVHAQAYRSAGIQVCHNEVSNLDSNQQNGTHRAEFSIERGDMVEMWCGEQFCRVEYHERPVVMGGTLPVEVYHNGVNLKDILRELAEL